MKLSIIIPTTDRITLMNTLASIKSQNLQPGDEVLVIGDGPCPVSFNIWQTAHLPGEYEELPHRHNDWGASPRHRGMAKATGDYLMFIDDDDVYLPRALDVVREKVSSGLRLPYMFRMFHQDGHILWEEPEIRIGNVSTQMFVPPNDKNKLGRWGEMYEGDFCFIRDTVNMYDGQVVWCDEILSKWRA